MRRIRWGDAINLVMARLYAEAHGSDARNPLRERVADVVAGDRYDDRAPPLSQAFLDHDHAGEIPGAVFNVTESPAGSIYLRTQGTELAVEVGGVSQGELNAAITTLYGKRDGARKRQRRRHGVTYKQRDEIAQLLLRLFHNGRLYDGR